MPPSPTTIPTSFVPKQPVRSGSPYAKSGGNTFFIVALVVLGISVVSAVGVFGFEQYLKSVRDSKAAAVQQAQDNLSTATVEEFIRTRDRFIAADSLLQNHVAASSFFTTLEELTLQSVRFSSLNFTLTESGGAEIEMEGVARSFNALAAQSSVFAGEKRIQRAIFSNITVGEGNTVTFSLTAVLDPRLISFMEKVPPQIEVEAVDGQATTSSALPEDILESGIVVPEEVSAPLPSAAPVLDSSIPAL